MAYVKTSTYDHDALPETCSEDHVPGCPGRAGGDHEYIVPVSYMRCSECGDLLDDGECVTHGLLDPNEGREGLPEFNGAFDRW